MNWDQSTWDSGHWDESPAVVLPPKRKLNRRTMASNPTPDNPDILRALADRMADGCHLHETPLGLLRYTEKRECISLRFAPGAHRYKSVMLPTVKVPVVKVRSS